MLLVTGTKCGRITIYKQPACKVHISISGGSGISGAKIRDTICQIGSFKLHSWSPVWIIAAWWRWISELWYWTNKSLKSGVTYPTAMFFCYSTYMISNWSSLSVLYRDFLKCNTTGIKIHQGFLIALDIWRLSNIERHSKLTKWHLVQLTKLEVFHHDSGMKVWMARNDMWATNYAGRLIGILAMVYYSPYKNG